MSLRTTTLASDGRIEVVLAVRDRLHEYRAKHHLILFRIHESEAVVEATVRRPGWRVTPVRVV